MLGCDPLCLHAVLPPRDGSALSHFFLEPSLGPDPGHILRPILIRVCFSPRSFAKPPKQVQTVCECILIMKGYKELNWKTAKGMMSDPNFLRSLMEIDFDSITQSQVKNIRGEHRWMEGTARLVLNLVVQSLGQGGRVRRGLVTGTPSRGGQMVLPWLCRWKNGNDCP